MKILLISDTHGKVRNLRTLMKRMNGSVDLILHMGDVEGDEEEIKSFIGCPIEFVRGNCDFMCREPDEKVLEVGGHRIYMTHGHKLGVKGSLAVLDEKAREAKADIVLFGHTHIQEHFILGGRRFINPGSLTAPHDRPGKYAYAVLEIDERDRIHVTLSRM